MMKRHLLQYLFDGGESYFARQEQRKAASSLTSAPAQTIADRLKKPEQPILQSGSPHQRSTAVRS